MGLLLGESFYVTLIEGLDITPKVASMSVALDIVKLVGLLISKKLRTLLR